MYGQSKVFGASVKSTLEMNLAVQLEMAKIIDYTIEYKFMPGRKFRFDFAWPQDHIMLGVECEGGIWSGGRHVSGAGFTKDCWKYNEALLLGWHVLRVTAEHINNGSALNWIERFLINCYERSEE